MNQQVIELCQAMLANTGKKITRELIAENVDEILLMPTFKIGVDREVVIKKLEEIFVVWVDEAQVLSSDDHHKP